MKGARNKTHYVALLSLKPPASVHKWLSLATFTLVVVVIARFACLKMTRRMFCASACEPNRDLVILQSILSCVYRLLVTVHWWIEDKSLLLSSTCRSTRTVWCLQLIGAQLRTWCRELTANIGKMRHCDTEISLRSRIAYTPTVKESQNLWAGKQFARCFAFN